MIRSVFSLRSLVYLLYAVLLIAVLLYVRFPSSKFKAYCEHNIERLLPGSTCTISRSAYHFPLSAAFETIKIIRTIEGRDSEITVDKVVVTPEPWHFWRTFKISGKMYSGTFRATLNLDKKAQTFQLTDVHFEGLDAGKLAEGIGLAERKISGTFEFSGEYKASSNSPRDGVGKGMIQLASGSMDLMQPILTLATIEFEKFTVHVSQQNDIMKLTGGELRGKEISADFTGELRLAYPVLDSNIQVSGHMEPENDFLKANPKEYQFVQHLLQRYKVTVLPFKIGGTVKNPLFRFST